MKLSDSIIIMGRLMDDLIKQSKFHQEELHNRNTDDATRAGHDAAGSRAAGRIEAICTCLGIQVKWPGLAPNFEVEGFWYNDFRDAVSMSFGQPTFNHLVTNEDNGWTYAKKE